MEPIPLVLEEEIALEGLDGITLDTLWFRLSERLKDFQLPLPEKFKNSIWGIILKNPEMELFEINEPRLTPTRLDRNLMYSENGSEEIDNVIAASYGIYTFHPVDHPVIRGSCQEFNTRKEVDKNVVRDFSLPEVEKFYGSKLVIVASQQMRERFLIPSNIGRDCDINNHIYCFLERIGRSRYFGEATSGPNSAMDFIKDSKLLHYFRKHLVKNNLVMRQQIQQKIRGRFIQIQLFHLPRYFVIVKIYSTLLAEKLFNFLIGKPDHTASAMEARAYLDINPKAFRMLIKSKEHIFENGTMTLNAVKDEDDTSYGKKSKKGRTIGSVKIINPSFDFFTLYNEHDENDENIEEEGYLDPSQQLVNTSLVWQVVEKIEQAGSAGMSQSEIAACFGLSKLNARAITRKVTSKNDITWYIKDEGRQRTSKFVHKKYKNAKTKLIVEQVAKLVQKAEEATAQQSVIQVTHLPTDRNESSEVLEEDFEMKISIPLDEEIIEIVHQTPVEETSAAHQHDDPYTIEVDDSCLMGNMQSVDCKMSYLNSLPGVKPCQGLALSIEQGKVSEKYLKRMNIVLDIVKEKTIVEGHHLLLMVRSHEQESTNVKMCRKSMMTLCNQLAADNFLKIIEMELKSPTNVIKRVYIGEPNVTLDMRCWTSIIEEQKIQHFLRPLNEGGKSEKIEQTFSALSFVSKQSERVGDFSAQSVKFTSDFPKFQKYKLFHEFLYYLIYNYPKEYQRVPINDAIAIWKRENQNIEDLEEVSGNISSCFSTDFNWKMFVPPLNSYREYKDGWALLKDIIHRIPLILYVKFTRYGAYVPDIKEYLNHPIKCNYLIHYLPGHVRDALLQGRRHASVLSDLCKRMCFLGLVQMGPNRLKEVDNTFIYLNRNASVMDTTETSGEYIQVDDQHYNRHRYFFDSPDVVADYWKEMMHVCVNTPVGKTNAPEYTKSFERRDVIKPELLPSLAPQTPETVLTLDTGEIPGDNRGAAGLDTWLYSHLRINWSKEPLPKVRRKRIKKEGVIRRRRTSIDGTRKKRIRNRTGVPKRRYPTKAEALTGIHHPGSTTAIIRKLKKGTKSKPADDEVDIKALKLIPSGGRCVWSDIEDEVLLLVKAAMKFVFKSDSMIPYYCHSSVIRDILHWRTSKALDKNTNACKRRILYLVKNKPQCKEKVAMYIEELSVTREFINYAKHFDSIFTNHKKIKNFRVIIKIHLVELVHRMHQYFLKQFMSNSIQDEKSFDLPLVFETLDNFCTIISIDSGNEFKFKEPTNPSQAEVASLTSLIHSGMCCMRDKTNNKYYLYETYKKYSDSHLTEASDILRRLQVASRNPHIKTQFVLSNRYALMLASNHVSVELYDEYLDELYALSSCESNYQLKTANCGMIFMLAENLHTQKIELTMEKAEKLIMVDPALQKRVDFEEISDKYNKAQTEDQKDDKKNKNVQLPNDSSSDVKFFHMEDPIEIFFKLNDFYLHIFCLLSALTDGESVKRGSWHVDVDDDACNVKSCLMKDHDSVDFAKFACTTFNTVDEILVESEADRNDNYITKGNFEKFFDTKIQEHILTNDEFYKKDSGKKMTSDFRTKITTQFLLKLIHSLTSESEQEEGAWLTEYKKISVANSDESYEDDEENDPLVLSSMTNQLKDLNVNVRSSDNFVVNLSKIFIDIAGEKKGEIIIDGDAYDDRLVSFNQGMRTKVHDKIKHRHVWLPDDLIRRSVELEVFGDQNLFEICQFLIKKGEVGATASEMIENFKDKKKLQRNVEKLEEQKMIVRTGVNQIRFVHKSCAFKWLLQTLYLTEKTGQDDAEPPEKKSRTEETDEQEENDQNYAQNPYYILPAPWIRVGPLNRSVNPRCLDKWLGTVLNFISINPCMLLNDINAKFNVLNPVHFRNLCEILEDIGCVKLMTHDTLEVDIFSEYQGEAEEEPATYFDAFDRTFVEVTKDAFQRLTSFIGKHYYQQSFV